MERTAQIDTFNRHEFTQGFHQLTEAASQNEALTNLLSTHLAQGSEMPELDLVNVLWLMQHQNQRIFEAIELLDNAAAPWEIREIMERGNITAKAANQ